VSPYLSVPEDDEEADKKSKASNPSSPIQRFMRSLTRMPERTQALRQTGNGFLVNVTWLRPNNSDVLPDVVSEDDRKAMREIFAKHFMLSRLQGKDIDGLLKCIERISIAEGDVVFHENEPGQCFYIVASGEFEVSIEGSVKRLLAEGALFGELALIYAKPRTATVTCIASGDLWRMNGAVVRKALNEQSMRLEQATLDFLDSDETFRVMPEADKHILAASCEVRDYTPGETIIERGSDHQMMFIVREGTVCLYDGSDNESRLTQGAVFGGDQGIDDVREARAVTSSVCLTLSLENFARLIKEIHSVIRSARNHAKIIAIPWISCLPTDVQRRVCQSFMEQDYEKGDVILEGGAPADLMVILDGEARVGEDIYRRGEIIGDTEVYSGVPMPADVVALGACCIHKIPALRLLSVLLPDATKKLMTSRQSFDSTDMKLFDQANVMKLTTVWSTLAEIPICKTMLPHQVTRLALAMQTAEYRADTVIFEEGSVADAFYLIMSGKVEVTTASKGRLRALVKGDYFGERGLLTGDARSASVVCLEDHRPPAAGRGVHEGTWQLQADSGAAHQASGRQPEPLRLGNQGDNRSWQFWHSSAGGESCEWVALCVEGNAQMYYR
jgi:CRP-like cAMP-binding protein